jgi:hypothetical protein
MIIFQVSMTMIDNYNRPNAPTSTFAVYNRCVIAFHSSTYFYSQFQLCSHAVHISGQRWLTTNRCSNSWHQQDMLSHYVYHRHLSAHCSILLSTWLHSFFVVKIQCIVLWQAIVIDVDERTVYYVDIVVFQLPVSHNYCRTLWHY